ncbi:extracellular solute-binding protein [Natronolimnohabitans sp. A-GB9]|uniref:extracellular solute-binding protein n=1 Tax=Natronolimnohabitans sp. A-GB9 TaxID=3069757 RepID=UPI0027B56979|nr:extracellular solute-binding protein [Natronolimnohabitans sp. A-GB9]MDQ2051755.1 extracellular solute-binding protein [Natronolimnohabitans sp. A-GB9]
MQMGDTPRRRYLGAVGCLVGGAVLSGCVGGEGNGDDVLGDPEYAENRPDPGGVSMDELPDLDGELTVYSSRSETRVGELLEYIDDEYDELTLEVRYDDTADLVNTIETEAETPADVFYGSESQSMTHLKEDGYTAELPDDVLEMVDTGSVDPDGHWAGFTRRFRAVAYNADVFDEDELPDDIFAYAEDDRFADDIMWPPDQGSFQAFVTAMRQLHGEEETREWVRSMVDDQNIEASPGGDSALAQAVGDGEVGVGLTNHYVVRDHGGEDLELTFTSGDAGAMYNVTGGTVMEGSEQRETAADFVAHLLSAEAQEYFATTTWEYPTIDGVDPLDELPGTDEFEPPELDLNELSELEPTLELLREEGIL